VHHREWKLEPGGALFKQIGKLAVGLVVLVAVAFAIFWVFTSPEETAVAIKTFFTSLGDAILKFLDTLTHSEP